MIRKLAIFLAILAATTAAAQDVIGRGTAEGRPVEILSDFSWRYIDDRVDEEGCGIVAGRIAFCAEDAPWLRLPQTPSPDVDAIYQLDERKYAILVIENWGSEDGLTVAAMRAAILRNAARAAGIEPGDVPVLEEFEAEIDGTTHPGFIYSVSIDGLNFIFHGTTVLLDESSAQIISYSLGNDVTEAMRDAHTDFLSHIRVGE